MKKRAGTGISLRPILITVFLWLLLLPAQAGAGLVELPGMAYKINAPLIDNLKALSGKKVNLTMKSGAVFGGVVKVVGKGLVHLEKLEGKEYFDALIRIEDISAIDARFRDYQR